MKRCGGGDRGENLNRERYVYSVLANATAIVSCRLVMTDCELKQERGTCDASVSVILCTCVYCECVADRRGVLF